MFNFTSAKRWAFQKAKCKLQQQERAFWKARCPLSYGTHSIGVGGSLLKMPTCRDQVLAQLSPRHLCLGLYTTYVEHESIFVWHQFNDNLSIPSLVYIDGWLEYEHSRWTYNNIAYYSPKDSKAHFDSTWSGAGVRESLLNSPVCKHNPYNDVKLGKTYCDGLQQGRNIREKEFGLWNWRELAAPHNRACPVPLLVFILMKKVKTRCPIRKISSKFLSVTTFIIDSLKLDVFSNKGLMVHWLVYASGRKYWDLGSEHCVETILLLVHLPKELMVLRYQLVWNALKLVGKVEKGGQWVKLRTLNLGKLKNGWNWEVLKCWKMDEPKEVEKVGFLSFSISSIFMHHPTFQKSISLGSFIVQPP